MGGAYRGSGLGRHAGFRAVGELALTLSKLPHQAAFFAIIICLALVAFGG